MKKLFVFILIFNLSSCNISETASLDKCLKATIEENNCMIALKSSERKGVKTLLLNTQCGNYSNMFYGKVLYDFRMNAKREKLYFDNYSIQNNLQDIFSLTKDEFEIILDKKKDFDKTVDELHENDKLRKIYDRLDIKIQGHLKYSDFELVTGKIRPTYDQFEGFTLIELEDGRYVTMSKTNAKNRVLITYSLTPSQNTIFGFSLE